jgi:hypothetical protein
MTETVRAVKTVKRTTVKRGDRSRTVEKVRVERTRKRTGKPSIRKGCVVYHGPSRLDGSEIVVILTASKNRKTGARTVQSWILRADRDPLSASRAGADESVCGDCPHRWHTGGKCYVNIGQAPLSVWRAWRDGKYPALAPRDAARLLGGRLLRIGSYGDPCAVPTGVWRALLRGADRHTGYTHQWHRPGAHHYRRFLRASCDTQAQAHAARSLGWRTFRVLRVDEALGNETLCPASKEAGFKSTCDRCALCDGADPNRPRRSVAIPLHGSDIGPIAAARDRAFAEVQGRMDAQPARRFALPLM